MKQGRNIRCHWRLLLALTCATSGLQAGVPGTLVDALRARAASQGEVRLIVQFSAPGTRFAELPAAARQAREQQIANLQASLASRALQPGMRELVRFRTIPFMVFSANADAVDRLASLPEVIGLQEDIPEYPTLASSIPVIGADTAWAAGHDGTGQAIAVLDTGVDTSHPYFPPAKLLAEACFSSDGSGGSKSLCPDRSNSSTAPGSGQNCAFSLCEHGTHVAGIAVGNNGTGPNIGVAKDAGLITIQVFSCTSGNCSSSGNIGSYPSDQILALEHVLLLSQSFDIAAVNMSLGGSGYESQAACDAANAARKEAIDNLRAEGIATIISGGNGSNRNGLSQPGCISSAISVGNSTDADTIAESSNVASFLGLLAPGSLIDSATPGGLQVSNSGTSMSAPHVAGAWAVLRGAVPQASADEILQALYQTGTSVDDQRSGGTVTDMRRINLDLALDLLGTPRPVIETSPQPGSVLDLGDVAVTAMGVEFDLEVTNAGDAELTLSCDISGVQESHFALIACPAALAPATSTDITLRCDPQAIGEFSATLTITSNDPDEGLLSFPLSCAGVAPVIDPDLPAGSLLDFGSVYVEESSVPLAINISNSGSAELNISCAVQGSHVASYQLVQCPANIPPAQSAPVQLQCTPNKVGARLAELRINSNDASAAELLFSLTCLAQLPPGTIFMDEFEAD